jgi:hypothetical protein
MAGTNAQAFCATASVRKKPSFSTARKETDGQMKKFKIIFTQFIL